MFEAQAFSRVAPGAGTQSRLLEYGQIEADGLAEEVVSTVLEIEEMVAVRDKVSEEAVEAIVETNELAVDATEELLPTEVPLSHTFLNTVPKPWDTLSITLYSVQ